jgi:GNAT superfamily N-acetyltransferase
VSSHPAPDGGFRGEPSVGLRPALPDDQELLYRVYRSTREPELALVDWDEAGKEAFVRMQFAAQQRHYRKHHAGASVDVVVVDGQDAGRLMVARRPDDVRIVDLALLPPYRGRGVGRALVEQVLAEAAATRRPVTIHVERFNPAMRLYARLGFEPLTDAGVHVLMEWRAVRADPQPKTAS